MPHPHLFVTKDPVDGLRSLSHVRASISQGHAKHLWEALLAKVTRESNEAPWIPSTPLPERKPTSVARANRDYDLVARLCNRIMDASLVALVTGESRWADAALRQIECLYDPAQWPEYEDQTHLDHGDHCSLRRGQLAVALGLTYDWLYDFLMSGSSWIRTRAFVTAAIAVSILPDAALVLGGAILAHLGRVLRGLWRVRTP